MPAIAEGRGMVSRPCSGQMMIGLMPSIIADARLLGMSTADMRDDESRRLMDISIRARACTAAATTTLPLPSRARIMLPVLAACGRPCDDRSGDVESQMRISMLCKLSGMTRAPAQRALADLRDAGAVRTTKLREEGTGRQRASVNRVVVGALRSPMAGG